MAVQSCVAEKLKVRSLVTVVAAVHSLSMSRQHSYTQSPTTSRRLEHTTGDWWQSTSGSCAPPSPRKGVIRRRPVQPCADVMKTRKSTSIIITLQSSRERRRASSIVAASNRADKTRCNLNTGITRRPPSAHHMLLRPVVDQVQ